jgi:hypothetical protein
MRVRNAAAATMLVAAAAGCRADAGPADDAEPVVRHFLSGDSDDWEPSLVVAGDGWVHVTATRRISPDSGATNPVGETHAPTWSTSDGGRSFEPERVFPRGGGDARIAADATGRVFASWIRVEWDSVASGFDLSRGGLVLATSDDHGETWRTALAAEMASGVADKPELAVSDDGSDVYLAFMARGTLDVVASHDGGETWSRHVVDTTYTGHWPSGIALDSDGRLFVVNARQNRGAASGVLGVELELHRSTDGGVTWDTHPISSSTRNADPRSCAHGPTCPVQIPFGSVATDREGGVYVAYTEGVADHPYRLLFERSDDGGVTWSDPAPLSEAERPVSGDLADVFYPMVAASRDGLVYAAWFDDRDGPVGVYARRSTDGGRSWEPTVELSPAGGLTGIYGEYGGLGIDADGVLHVTWAEGVGHVGNPGAHGGTWYARWNGRALPLTASRRTAPRRSLPGSNWAARPPARSRTRSGS